MTAEALAETIAPAPLPENVEIIDVAKIRRCEHQPRQHDRKPDPQFVESVRVHGVLQPILVTAAKTAGFYDIVFGEMRWTACKLTGREQIPAIVRVMEPNEIYEVQVIENSARKDVHPLDESDAFAELIKRGYTAERIASRLGRPMAYVAQRLKLRELGKECRKALDEERITLSVAVLLARIPDAKLQLEALEEVGGNSDWDKPMTAEAARKAIEEQFMLRLDAAPFDITDAELVPKAGACTACPKRTGQQRELFADASSPDLCVDPVCHRSKVDALWKIKSKEAKSGGVQVIEGNAADKATQYGGGYRKLTDTEWVGEKKKTVKQLLGKETPPIILARGTDGVVHELVKRGDVDKVLKVKAPARDKSADQHAERQKREEQKTKLRRKAILMAIELAAGKASKLALDDVLGFVVEAFAMRAWSEVQRGILERRGFEVKGGDLEKQLVAMINGLQLNGEVAGVGIELAMRSFAPWHQHGGVAGSSGKLWTELLKWLKIDFAELERQVTAAEKEKKATKGKAGAKKPKSTPGVCRDCGCTDTTPCVDVVGQACSWTEADLCSACADKGKGKPASKGVKAKPAAPKPKRKPKLQLTARQAKAKSRKALKK